MKDIIINRYSRWPAGSRIATLLRRSAHMKWQDRRLLDLFGIEHPILQAPMAGISTPQMAVAASEAGGLGAIAAAMLTPDGLRTEMQIAQQGTGKPLNVNFF